VLKSCVMSIMFGPYIPEGLEELYCPWCGGKHIYIYDEHSVGAGQPSDRRITSKKENDSNSNRISKE